MIVLPVWVGVYPFTHKQKAAIMELKLLSGARKGVTAKWQGTDYLLKN